MVQIDRILMKNCRLCHTKSGLYNIKADKKMVKDIYECLKIRVNDKVMELLPHSVCEECKSTIKSFSLFKQHVRKVDQTLRKILKNDNTPKDTSEEQFKCTQCPAEFNNKDIFKKHLDSHSVNSKIKDVKIETEIPCLKCRQIFKSLEEYGSHNCYNKTKEDTKESTEADSVDGEDHNFDSDVFDDKATVANLKHKDVKFICTWKNCNKILSSAYSLKTHQLKHQGKRSFLCVTCGKGFITKNSLTCHEKIHLDVKGYVCKLCNIGFSVRSNLRAHEKKHHEGVRFYCSQCTKAFSSKCSLERHERIHTGIKDFKCQSCPSAFYTRKELLKHQRYHQGLRLHKCDECFKTFFERHHLIIHLRSHTGERPYVCKFPDCGKSFAESQKLKRHHNAKHAQT